MRHCIFALFIFININLHAQLLPNGGFEIDTVAPFGKPDFFRFRYADFHELETDTVRSGSYAARFNNIGPENNAGYYYSHYDATGSEPNFLQIAPGEVYEFSFWFRTAIDFIGEGIGAQILFANENNQWLGNVAIEPYRISSGQWTLMSISATIPSTVSKISTGIYYDGIGKAWIDDVQLQQTGYPLAPNLSYETDTILPLDKPDNHLARFQNYHHRETDFHQTYLGNGAAKFNNTSGQELDCYFYSNYNGSGTTRQAIQVHPNDRYRLTGFTRTSEDFTGVGMSLCAIFFDENGNFVARNDSPSIVAPTWEKIDFEVTVPDDATQMIYSTEYKGIKQAWFDQVNIELTNPLLNSGFETDIATPANKPDFWKARFGESDTVADIETNPLLVYAGDQCVRFRSSENAISYYYGPYSGTGQDRQYISVMAGQEFELNAQTKTSTDFSGNGLRMSILFWVDEVFHSRINSPWIENPIWTQESLTAIVPDGVNGMTVSLEFFGLGTGWYDNVELNDLDKIWYLRDAPINVFESLSFSGEDLIPVGQIIDRFKYHDTIMQLKYNHDGTWGIGYACQPLIRISGNAAIGYLNAYSVIPIQRYLDRAYDALDYLVEDQQDNGAFIWYNDTVNCGEGTLKVGAVMYEGGIAVAALMRGYEISGNPIYLNAANKFCQYLVGRPPSANANFTGFAMWALTENYRLTSNTDFLETALIYFESLHAFQLNSGMWADTHNQHIHYHGIVMRALVNLMRVISADHPKRKVVSHAIYKGINHIIRSQRPGGLMHRYPFGTIEQYSMFTLDPMVMAWDKLGFKDLESQINAYTIGAKIISPETTQGHRFASLGLLLHHYYQRLDSCPPDYASSNRLTGKLNDSAIYTSIGKLESEQQILESATNVEYNSNESVELFPGFSVGQTSIFEVLMDGCY